MLEITLQRETEQGYTVVLEESQPGTFLPIRTEGIMTLDMVMLQSQSNPLAYGTLLGQNLFQHEIRDAFIRARSESQDFLRLLLSIEDPTLKTLHWERLCAPQAGGQWQFLKLDQRVIYSLYLPSVTDLRFPPIGRRDLRALILTANPNNIERYKLTHFDEPATIASVQTALGDVPQAVLGSVEEAVGLPTLDELCAQLTTTAYTLLHIVAHGRYIKRRQETALYLADQNNQVAPIPISKLIKRLSQIQRLPHFVFLSTCESANPEAEAGLGGLAQRLVRELGIPAVVAMSEPVSIKTAGLLASQFYQRLREHGEADRALTEATTRLAEAHDVTVPALYSRLGNRPIFSIALDKVLTNEEIKFGLAQLDILLTERAPVNKPQLIEQQAILQPTLNSDETVLSQTARLEREGALNEINKLSEAVLDISFNGLALGETLPAYDARCPFPGLESFRDPAFFFGRETLVQKIVKKLLPDFNLNNNFLAVLGPSGSGKSSLVLAGVVPALGYPYVRMVPSYDPLPQLATALAILHEQVMEGHAVLVVDQFEEIFTLCPDSKQRQRFFETLLKLADPQKRSEITLLELEIIVTMRADFWGECANYATLKDAMQTNQELIGPMSLTTLRGVIEQQARVVGLRFEAGLSQMILDDVQDAPGAMPLLQHALLELWYRRHGRWLNVSEYQDIGRVKRAIAGTAEKIYGQLSRLEQDQMRDIFIRLTNLDIENHTGDTHRDTRRRVKFSELLTNDNEATNLNNLVQTLASARLIITSINAASGEQELEVAHEALIRNWPRLREWLNEDRAALKVRQSFNQLAQTWDNADRLDGLLPRWSNQLAEEIKLLHKAHFNLNKLEKAFITACESLHEREQLAEVARLHRERRAEKAKQRALLKAKEAAEQAKIAAEKSQQAAEALAKEEKERAELAVKTTKRLQLQRVVLAIIGVIAIGMMVAAFFSAGAAQKEKDAADIARNKAEEQTKRAIAQRVLSRADELSTKNPPLAMLLTLTAQNLADNLPINKTQASFLYNYMPIEKTLQGHTQEVSQVTFSPDGQLLASSSDDKTVILWNVESGEIHTKLEGHSKAVIGIAFSPDGNTLATASFDGTVIVWNTATGDLIQLFSSNNVTQFFDVAFHPNGNILAATTARSKTIIVWDTTTGEELITLHGHSDDTHGLSFSPDGLYLASASRDKTVRLWDWTTGEVVQVFENGHIDSVWQAIFHPNLEVLTSIASDGQVIMWDIATGQQLSATFPDNGIIFDIAFNANGSQLVAASEDGQVIRWQVVNNQLQNPTYLLGHTAEVQGVAFNGANTKLASASADKTVLIWDIVSPLPSRTLTGHMANVYSLAFSPNSRWLASGSYDGTIKIWDTTTGQLLKTLYGHGNKHVTHVLFNQDGRILISGSADTTIRLWDTNSWQEKAVFKGHTNRITNLALSPDGEKLASSSFDRTVRIWDLASGEQITRWESSGRTIFDIEFSPDGTQLAAAAEDKMLFIWDLQIKQLTDAITLHKDWVTAVEFSPDGQEIATGSQDRTIKIWDIATANPITLTTEHTNWVTTIKYQPDGEYLASGAKDQSVIFWDTTSWQIAYKLLPHNKGIESIRFSPDNKLFASGSSDRTIQLLNLAFLHKPSCDLMTRNLTLAEWQKYVSQEMAYQITCHNLPPAPGLILEGYRLAHQGDLAEAVFIFEQAKIIDPEIEFDDAYEEAHRIHQEKVENLIETGRDFAQLGYQDQAIEILEEALMLDPAQDLNPSIELEEIRDNSTRELLGKALTKLRGGHINQAYNLFTQIDNLEDDFLTADDWHLICLEGALHDKADVVIKACDKAIELEPDNGQLYNSRAIVQLQLGNKVGARADFEKFEAWLNK